MSKQKMQERRSDIQFCGWALPWPPLPDVSWSGDGWVEALERMQHITYLLDLCSLLLLICLFPAPWRLPSIVLPPFYRVLHQKSFEYWIQEVYQLAYHRQNLLPCPRKLWEANWLPGWKCSTLSMGEPWRHWKLHHEVMLLTNRHFIWTVYLVSPVPSRILCNLLDLNFFENRPHFFKTIPIPPFIPWRFCVCPQTHSEVSFVQSSISIQINTTSTGGRNTYKNETRYSKSLFAQFAQSDSFQSSIAKMIPEKITCLIHSL